MLENIYPSAANIKSLKTTDFPLNSLLVHINKTDNQADHIEVY